MLPSDRSAGAAETAATLGMSPIQGVGAGLGSDGSARGMPCYAAGCVPIGPLRAIGEHAACSTELQLPTALAIRLRCTPVAFAPCGRRGLFVGDLSACPGRRDDLQPRASRREIGEKGVLPPTRGELEHRLRFSSQWPTAFETQSRLTSGGLSDLSEDELHRSTVVLDHLSSDLEVVSTKLVASSEEGRAAEREPLLSLAPEAVCCKLL